MRKFNLIAIVSLLLASCVNATPELSATQTQAPTSTLTLIPTLTQTPTATSMPSLPETIEFSFENTISEETQNKIKAVVNHAYWFYVGIGCSPDGFRASFYVSKEEGEGGYTDTDSKGVWIEAGVASIESNPSKTTGAISHEIAHAMCQIAFTKPKPGQLGGIDMRWLTEGLANYFSGIERIADGDIVFNYSNISEFEKSRFYIKKELCGTSLLSLEAKDADKVYGDAYFTVGITATILLTKTTPDNYKALMNYYKFLNAAPASQAFEEAFGRTKEEFYQQYQDECEKGFPTILK